MEEAYSELYQQFLQLRSLCLRQAALLHQLTTALQKKQGSYVYIYTHTFFQSNSNSHKQFSYDSFITPTTFCLQLPLFLMES